MANKTILILTPHSNFGDILKQTLKRSLPEEVIVASSSAEADLSIRICENIPYAFMDMELGLEEVIQAGLEIKSHFPHAKLVVISKTAPFIELARIQPWIFLKKPFSQRELFSIFRPSTGAAADAPEIIDLHFHENLGENFPAWLGDAAHARETLAAAVSHLDVQEAMIFSERDVLAHAGQMPSETIDECSRILFGAFKGHHEPQIIIPVHLQSSQQSHLFHATLLAINLILALAYDAQTPYEIVRSHSIQVSRTLKNTLVAPGEARLLPEGQAASRLGQLHFPGRTGEPGIDFERSTRYSSRLVQLRQAGRSWSYLKNRVDPPLYIRSGMLAPEETSRRVSPRPQSRPSTYEPFNRDYGQPEMGTSRIQSERANRSVPPGSLSSGLSYFSGNFSGNYMESSSPQVLYACLLVPRMKSHLLDDQIADLLRDRLPEYFQALGWRLAALEINPSYLQWLAGIPPTISPAAHIKEIRTQSSKLVLAFFPHLDPHGLLRDFWAPGFLLGYGPHLIPSQEVREYIRINRMQHYS